MHHLRDEHEERKAKIIFWSSSPNPTSSLPVLKFKFSFPSKWSWHNLGLISTFPPRHDIYTHIPSLYQNPKWKTSLVEGTQDSLHVVFMPDLAREGSPHEYVALEWQLPLNWPIHSPHQIPGWRYVQPALITLPTLTAATDMRRNVRIRRSAMVPNWLCMLVWDRVEVEKNGLK